jgi:hypothetical protein
MFSEVLNFAMPKSVNRTYPFSSKRMFYGLISRCMTLLACICSKANVKHAAIKPSLNGFYVFPFQKSALYSKYGSEGLLHEDNPSKDRGWNHLGKLNTCSLRKDDSVVPKLRVRSEQS